MPTPHVPQLVDPTTPAKKPAAQEAQPVAPVEALYCPTLHEMQLGLLEVRAAAPAAQGTQLDAAAWA